MAAKFELYKDKDAKFRWRLNAANGETIAAGQAYESKAAALNGIESVQKNAPVAQFDDQT
ncbi:YegP family protein [Nocardia sp. CWNU-33]|uniref:YegP family protein n=1 Tax=Nocardia sp. CWNU-33 TaxID=3392117 RepID=UPI00398EF1D2